MNKYGYYVVLIITLILAKTEGSLLWEHSYVTETQNGLLWESMSSIDIQWDKTLVMIR